MKRVYIVFSSDDMTVLYVLLSHSNEEDRAIKNWIFVNGWDENRIEVKEITNVH